VATELSGQCRNMSTLPGPPVLTLEGYQGPLDLLLNLVRSQKINIYDIPIARITEQYMQYLRSLAKMNINTAGEFVLMAVTLIQIKSRVLLPRNPAAGLETRKTHDVNSWTNC
jgi:segregation and condensation protein A